MAAWDDGGLYWRRCVHRNQFLLELALLDGSPMPLQHADPRLLVFDVKTSQSLEQRLVRTLAKCGWLETEAAGLAELHDFLVSGDPW